MPPDRSKRLVIDANVASASGGKGVPQGRAVKCYSVLMAARAQRHRLVMADQIESEWRNEESAFANKWRHWMQRRGLVWWLPAAQLAGVNLDLSSLGARPVEIRSMQEDAVYVKAAIRTDNIVISLDDEARRLFARACAVLPDLATVMWMNPEQESSPGRWLSRGAPTEERRTLSKYATP